jgi:hypothetical protein
MSPTKPCLVLHLLDKSHLLGRHTYDPVTWPTICVDQMSVGLMVFDTKNQNPEIVDIYGNQSTIDISLSRLINDMAFLSCCEC